MIVRGAMLAVLLAALVVVAVIERRRRAQEVAEAYGAVYRLSPEYQAALRDVALAMGGIGEAMIPSIRAVAAAFSDLGPVLARTAAAFDAFGEAWFDGQPLDEEFPT